MRTLRQRDLYEVTGRFPCDRRRPRSISARLPTVFFPLPKVRSTFDYTSCALFRDAQNGIKRKGGREGEKKEKLFQSLNFISTLQKVKWRFDNYLINLMWVNSSNGTWLNTIVLKMWSLDWLHLHPLRTCEKCRFWCHSRATESETRGWVPAV